MRVVTANEEPQPGEEPSVTAARILAIAVKRRENAVDAGTDGEEMIVVGPGGQNVAIRYVLSEETKQAIQGYDGESLDDLLGGHWLLVPEPKTS